MKTSIIATIMAASFAISCSVKVQVKKDAKNSGLSSTTTSSTANLHEGDDFLKQLDGLRTTAADLIVKQLATHDYVGAFRGSVRKYRSFIIDKSAKKVLITDSFYSDSSKDCRSSGLSLNLDNNNEMLGMILKTVVLAKLSEADMGKINTALAKEMQAVVQFITMELGVDIQGTSTVADVNGMKVTKGNVAIKLKPIDGELIDGKPIDEATKKADDVQVLNLNFERALGEDNTGTFVATMDLPYEKDGASSEATGNITVSRVKEADQHVHDIVMTMGTKGETPTYTRELIVKDVKAEPTKFEFLDIMNVGTNDETRNSSIIDLKAGTQCKGSAVAKSEEKPAKEPVVEEPIVVAGGSSTTTGTPSKSPTQTPVQGKIGPTQMK